MICICHVSDKMVREVAKRDKVPLRWLREAKRMHNQYRIHEFFNEYVVRTATETGAVTARHTQPEANAAGPTLERE